MHFSQAIPLLLLAVPAQAMPLFNGGFEDPPAECKADQSYKNLYGARFMSDATQCDNNLFPFYTSYSFWERFESLPGWNSTGGCFDTNNGERCVNFERWSNDFIVPSYEGNSHIELNTEGLTTIANHPAVMVENCDFSTITFRYRARTNKPETFKATITNLDSPDKTMTKEFTSKRGVWKLGVVGPIMVMNQDSLSIVLESTNGPLNGANRSSLGNLIDDVQEKCTSPSMAMDPHVQKWNGDSYDFMGECDLVFLTEPGFGNGAGLDIHARTKLRNDYSFVETAAIRIGEDILEVSSWGDWSLNGVSFSNALSAPLSIAGYPVYHRQLNKKKNVFDIVVDSGNITVDNFKDFVNIKIRTPLPGSKGLLGDFYTGDSLARDGETVIEDPNAFGQEWQVLDSEPNLFQTNRAPQFPNKCILPSESKKEARRLGDHGVSEEAAKLACAKFQGSTFESCVHDVMATGDLEVADAGAY